MTERELIEGCKMNDRKCQQLVFQLYAGKLLAVCRRYARHEMEAEDYVQEAFILAFKNIHSFAYKSLFEFWIRRIAINVALKHVKKSAFKKENIGIVEGYDAPAHGESAISKLSADEIITYISKLPDGYRAVFNLYAIDGFSHKEVAKQLNITESTSRSQLTKARRALIELFESAQKVSIYE